MPHSMEKFIECDESDHSIQMKIYPIRLDEMPYRGNFSYYLKRLHCEYASEDKDTFVRPLATALQRAGLKVWYDDRDHIMSMIKIYD